MENEKLRGFEIAKGFENENIAIPHRSTPFSACYDIRALGEYTIEPHSKKVLSTGIKAYMQDDEVLNIYVRSSIGIKRGLTLANGTGIIDADYYSNEKNDGHIMIALFNNTDETVTIENGERIAQGMFIKYLTVDNDEPLTQERKGGIGSTGVK